MHALIRFLSCPLQVLDGAAKPWWTTVRTPSGPTNFQLLLEMSSFLNAGAATLSTPLSCLKLLFKSLIYLALVDSVVQLGLDAKVRIT